MKLETPTEFPINTPVRIIAAGGLPGNWLNAIAITGATQKRSNSLQTNLRALASNGEIVEMPWRTDFLEQLVEGEETEKLRLLGLVPAVAAPALQELSVSEERDRHNLELKVERVFIEAGAALKEIRDRKLYRNTHETFEEYCNERFDFNRVYAYRLIAAVGVVENLKTSTQMYPNGIQVLPTGERQVRDLITLKPEIQREVWDGAVEEAGGKVPTGAAIKGIVQRIKERDNTPPPPEYQEGEVVEIRSGGSPTLRKHDGFWGIITHVGSWSYRIHISVRNEDVNCKGSEMKRIDEKYTSEIKAVAARISALQRCDLDPIDGAALEVLQRFTCFTPRQYEALATLEAVYKIKSPLNA